MTLSNFTMHVKTWQFIDYLYDGKHPLWENECVTVNFIDKGIIKNGKKVRNTCDEVSVFDQLSDDQLTVIIQRINSYYNSFNTYK